MPISIHAPTRGATLLHMGCAHIRLFQSTLPQGERPSHSLISYIISYISIHAPTRGATQRLRSLDTGEEFQSTLPQGERPKFDSLSSLSSSISIHAPTRGATLIYFNILSYNLYFNPRSHKGSDGDLHFENLVIYNISIHAPTRGATAISHKKIFLSSEIL